MTNPPRAKTARFIKAAPDQPVMLFLQFDADQPRVIDVMADGSRIEQVEINQDQLRNFVADGAGMLEVKV